MELSRAKKILLGVATAWPAVYLASTFLLSVAGFAYLEIVGPAPGLARFAQSSVPLFYVVYVLTMADLLALFVVYWYLVLVRFPGNLAQSVLWSVIILATGLPGQAAFYFLQIWPGKKRDLLGVGTPPDTGPILSPGVRKGYLAFRIVALLPYGGTTLLYTFVLVFMALESAEWGRPSSGDERVLIAFLSAIMLGAAIAATAIPWMVSRRGMRKAAGAVRLEAHITARFAITALLCTPLTTVGFVVAFMARNLFLWFVAVALGAVPLLFAWPTGARRTRWALDADG